MFALDEETGQLLWESGLAEGAQILGVTRNRVVVSVAGAQSVWLGVASAVFTAAGLAYAVWDDAGYGVRPVSVAAWVGVALGAVVAGLRGGWWAAGQRVRVRR